MLLPKQEILTYQENNKVITGKNIVAIGIQGPRGTRFCINESELQDDNAIVLGKTGIYELDLTNGFGLITSIIIEIKNLQPAEQVIVDYLYKAEEA